MTVRHWERAASRTERLRSHGHCEPRPIVPTPEGSTTPRGSAPREGAAAGTVLQTRDEARTATAKASRTTLAAYLHTRDKSLERGDKAKNVLCAARLSEGHGRRTHKTKTFSCPKRTTEVFSQSVGGKTEQKIFLKMFLTLHLLPTTCQY